MIVLLAIALANASAPDSILTLGRVERDLTGDSVPEVLNLTGVPVTADSLVVSLTIQSAGKTLYRLTWPLKRSTAVDYGRKKLSDVEWQTFLNELGPAFFKPTKFKSTDGFLAMLRKNARLHVDLIPDVMGRDGARDAATLWAEMQTSGVTVFEFSTGGDGVTAIAWSTTDKRFYRLLECC